MRGVNEYPAPLIPVIYRLFYNWLYGLSTGATCRRANDPPPAWWMDVTMSRTQQRTGKQGENLAESTLSGLGIEMLEKIGTPILAIPAGRGLYKVIWEKKVSGDRRGILPGGRSVLIEVKTILDHNLTYSELEPHQHAGLKEHADWGGLSLLVWVHNTGVYVMEYPISGFIPRTSLTPQVAEIWNEITRVEIAERLK